MPAMLARLYCAATSGETLRSSTAAWALIRSHSIGRDASEAASYGRIRFDDLQWKRGYRPNLAYAQSKLADLMLSLHLADLAAGQGWNLMSNAAHPGFTRTNLQTAGASLGRDKPKRTPFNSFTILPSQEVGPGTEPLLYAATDAAIANAVYHATGIRVRDLPIRLDKPLR